MVIPTPLSRSLIFWQSLILYGFKGIFVIFSANGVTPHKYNEDAGNLKSGVSLGPIWSATDNPGPLLRFGPVSHLP